MTQVYGDAGWRACRDGRVSPMSDLGQSRRFDDVRVTSAFPPIATKERTSRDVSNVPEADITSLHSITSSARASSVGEMVRPSALAGLRLTTNSNLFGACTGSSPGLAPRRIRSTYVAARRNSSAVFTAI